LPVVVAAYANENGIMHNPANKPTGSNLKILIVLFSNIPVTNFPFLQPAGN
jgi:hypothetical protein